MITSYTTLKSSLNDWLDSLQYAGKADEFIQMAEAHFNRELRTPEMERTVTQTVTGATIALPDDFLSMRSIYVDASPDIVMDGMTLAALRQRYPFSTAGTVRAYAVEGTNIVLAPPPSAATVLNLQYHSRIPALSTSNATNWLLASHPDLYLRAARYYAYDYMRDEAAAAREFAFVQGIIDNLNTAAHQQRIPATPLSMKPTSWA